MPVAAADFAVGVPRNIALAHTWLGVVSNLQFPAQYLRKAGRLRAIALYVKTIEPLLLPQAVVRAGKVIPIYPTDEISVDHSHQDMANDLDIADKTGIAARLRYCIGRGGSLFGHARPRSVRQTT
jgi:hypothetical protein